MSATFDRLLNFHETACFDPLTLASLAVTAIGTGVSAAGSMAAGQNAEALGKFQQAQYAQQSENDVATGQRGMLEQQYQGKLLQSRLTARAAGGGATPSVGSDSGVAQQLAGRSTYDSLMKLSAGQDMAAGETNLGSGAAYQGDLSQSMAPYAALGSIASGAGSMFKTASSANLFPKSWGSYG